MNGTLARLVSTMAVAAAIVAASGPVNARSSEELADVAMKGTPLTTEELYRLYKGKSWFWKDGIAYFRVSMRQFSAWAKPPGPEASYADGMWFLPGYGKLCFRATWNGVEWSKKGLSCFEHRADPSGAIYVHKVPDGNWWVFRDSPPGKYDEIKKFKTGDYAAKGVSANKSYIERMNARN
jgi:hypothetical protein